MIYSVDIYSIDNNSIDTMKMNFVQIRNIIFNYIENYMEK